jgi:hypothetical protein
MGQNIAHEVHTTMLPGGVQCLGNGPLEQEGKTAIPTLKPDGRKAMIMMNS